MTSATAFGRRPEPGKIVAVTGAGGFIGRHVSRVLRERGHHVVWLVRPGHDPERGADVVREDLSNLDRLAGTLASVGPDAVCHCAWSGHPRSVGIDYASQISADLIPSANLAVACGLAGVKQLVLLSSGGAMADSLKVSERPPAYGWAKRAAESVMATTARDFGYRLAALRPTAVYGPGQDPSKGLGAVTIFAGNMLRHEPLQVYGSLDYGRDFLHVADLADCIARVVESTLTGTFEVGGPDLVRLSELVALLEDTLGRKANVRVDQATGLDPLLVELDNRPITAATGWEPWRRLADTLPEVVLDVAVRLGLTRELPVGLRERLGGLDT